jgi:hypothetical protein
MSNVEDDEEAQKRGVVACAYLVDAALQHVDNLQIHRKQAKLRTALPVRINAIHLCYNDPLLVPLMSLRMFIMGSHSVMRFRAHYGSPEEVLCKLSSFGIPISALPVSSGGEVNLENHRTFMAMRRAIETTKSKRKGPLPIEITRENVLLAAPQPNIIEPTGYGGGLIGFCNYFDFMPLPSFANPWRSVVGAPNLASVLPPHRQLPVYPASRITATLCKSPAKPHLIYNPCPNDILLGRGKPIQARPANVRFREMLDKHMDKYNTREKGVKVIVSSYIVRVVKEEGGRFLKELEDGGWVEVNETTARAKVSHAFRTRRQVFQANLKKDRSTA